MNNLEKIKKKIKNRKNTILWGPPGTGKSRLVDLVFKELGESLGLSQILQFHKDYSYQDFIFGYVPDKNGFKAKIGALLQFINDMKDSDPKSEKTHVLFIDEINRGHVASIFGELLYLLDDQGKRSVTLPRMAGLDGINNLITLPKNLVIIGAMNSADRSTGIFDFALRRRFSFIYIAPDYDGLKEWLSKSTWTVVGMDVDKYIKFAHNLNKRIANHPMLGRNMLLGQSLFYPSECSSNNITLEDLTINFNENILPQLESYFGGASSSEIPRILSPNIWEIVRNNEEPKSEDFMTIIRLLAGDQTDA
jgi:5-methylcytosine-specific restriction protein B